MVVGRPFGRLLLLLVMIPVLLLAACGDEDEEVAEDVDTAADVTPSAIASLPEGVEAADLAISNGQFDADQLTLQQDQPTIIRITNNDDTVYRFQISDDLVTPTEIAAGTTTEVELTTPNAGRFEGQLLPAEGEEVRDTIEVVVQAPGGTSP